MLYDTLSIRTEIPYHTWPVRDYRKHTNQPGVRWHNNRFIRNEAAVVVPRYKKGVYRTEKARPSSSASQGQSVR